MFQNIKTAIVYTVITTILFGLIYPFAVTGLAQLLFKDKANGQLIYAPSSAPGEPMQLIGSRIIGQSFAGPAYFHSRPSAAGNGYDAANSGGSNYAPTNRKLADRIAADVAANQVDHPNEPVPIDLVTTSASGLDPDITPAAAEYQVARVALARHLTESTLRELVAEYTQGRQFGFLGEPRVNCLELNLALDQIAAPHPNHP